MPYAFTSPEWANEKGLDASLAFRLFGINSYHCVEPPVQGSTNVENFLKRDTAETLGAVMTVNTDPKALAAKIIEDIDAARGTWLGGLRRARPHRPADIRTARARSRGHRRMRRLT